MEDAKNASGFSIIFFVHFLFKTVLFQNTSCKCQRVLAPLMYDIRIYLQKKTRTLNKKIPGLFNPETYEILKKLDDKQKGRIQNIMKKSLHSECRDHFKNHMKDYCTTDHKNKHPNYLIQPEVVMLYWVFVRNCNDNVNYDLNDLFELQEYPEKFKTKIGYLAH
eukprot:NODE_17_length_41373_cov_0.337016.p23 type:complete len:164 gc:universal NODE_17_length_41373_cov_0.337016:15137-14646(-)